MTIKLLRKLTLFDFVSVSGFLTKQYDICVLNVLNVVILNKKYVGMVSYTRMKWLFSLNNRIIDFWLNCCTVTLSVIYLNSGGFYQE